MLGSFGIGMGMANVLAGGFFSGLIVQALHKYICRAGMNSLGHPTMIAKFM